MIVPPDTTPELPAPDVSATVSPAAPEAPAARLGRPKASVVVRWARVAITFVAALVAVGQASALHPVADMLSSFQVQYFVVALALTALLTLGRSWRWTLVGAICLLVTGAKVAPWYFPVGGPTRAGGTRPWRLMLANVCQENTRYDDVCK
jgi:hypothetical protein